MDLYACVRRVCHIDRMRKREAARALGIGCKTLGKMLAHSVPPGYVLREWEAGNRFRRAAPGGKTPPGRFPNFPLTPGTQAACRPDAIPKRFSDSGHQCLRV